MRAWAEVMCAMVHWLQNRLQGVPVDSDIIYGGPHRSLGYIDDIMNDLRVANVIMRTCTSTLVIEEYNTASSSERNDGLEISSGRRIGAPHFFIWQLCVVLAADQFKRMVHATRGTCSGPLTTNDSISTNTKFHEFGYVAVVLFSVHAVV